jgi:transcriptional regulator of acetoin/glycerol metabolism
MAALHGTDVLGVAHLPETFRATSPGKPRQPTQGALEKSTVRMAARAPGARDQDLKRFTHALRQTGGNVKLAAGLSGLSRQRVYRLLRGRSPAELLRVTNGETE